MYNRIIFYNHFGAGDIFESREFVKEWMLLIPAKEYFYAHGKHPDILKDLPQLKYCEVTPEMEGMNDVYERNGTLYVNTWIGRDSKYVLPGIGCVVEQSHRMFNDMLSKITEKRMRQPPDKFFPNLNYSPYFTKNIDEFTKTYSEVDKVLICNGNVQSNQATNFDFRPVIDILSAKYPHKLFLLTTPINDLAYDNVFYTTHLIGKYTFDLNEISYLSQSCRVIIGRKSGPFVFTGTEDNWYDHTKIFLSFTHTPQGSSFAVNQKVSATKVWSAATDTHSVVSSIMEVLG